jgi:hypothetical protein
MSKYQTTRPHARHGLVAARGKQTYSAVVLLDLFAKPRQIFFLRPQIAIVLGPIEIPIHPVPTTPIKRLFIRKIKRLLRLLVARKRRVLARLPP